MSHILRGPEAIVGELLRMVPAGSGFQMPPPAFDATGAEFLEYAPGGTLKASFPAAPAFGNPMGMFLGAATGAAMDVLFGTLAFLETRSACTTVTMEMAFVRPIIADGHRFHCEVSIRARTKRLVFLEGRAFNQANKLAVTATSTMMILSE